MSGLLSYNHLSYQEMLEIFSEAAYSFIQRGEVGKATEILEQLTSDEKIKLAKTIFNLTLIYLILQAGFMLGYSFHELFSYFKAESMLDSGHWIYTKAYDLSDTFLICQSGISNSAFTSPISSS